MVVTMLAIIFKMLTKMIKKDDLKSCDMLRSCLTLNMLSFILTMRRIGDHHDYRDKTHMIVSLFIVCAA